MKKVAIIGSAGQLGTDLASVFSLNKGIELYLLDHSSLECADKLSVEKALFDINPEVVINCAAFVRVDDCEEETEKAYSVNARGAGYIAQACTDIGATVVYISTDYVFDGWKSAPYTEEDSPNPLNVYGRSKLKGERLVRDFCPKHFIVRSSGLYGLRQGGKRGSARNFVETILKLAGGGGPVRVVDDQTLTPTFTLDLARAVAELVHTDRYGTYHITNSGECSWFEFGKAVFEISGLDPNYGPVSSSEYGARALRPTYSALDNSKIHQLGILPLRGLHDALSEYLGLRSRA